MRVEASAGDQITLPAGRNAASDAFVASMLKSMCAQILRRRRGPPSGQGAYKCLPTMEPEPPGEP